MPAPVDVSIETARRFARRALGLDTPFPSVATALDHFGYVQIDPLNICGRMHDLILRNRVQDYREGDLVRHVHTGDAAGEGGAEGPGGHRPAEQRIAFEHHLPETHILAVFPLEAWPHLRDAMRQRARRTSAWSGKLTLAEKRLAPRLLAEIEERGPLGSEQFDDAGRSRRSVWGTSTRVKATLQKLFFHGELLIAARDQNRRRYDLPHRVLPAAVLAQPPAPAAETRRWLARLKLRQRRLAVLKREEAVALGDEATPVRVTGCPLLHVLSADLPLLETVVGEGTGGDRRPLPADVRLLAPLDPLIYDRRVTGALWAFDYTWEAYTPAAKRRRGHYALPVLAGTELVGHVEPKADRTAGRLLVASRGVRRGCSVTAALDELAEWLGLRR